MQEGAVLYEKRGAIALASLNRPEVLNAYDVTMRDGLFAVLTAVRDDPEVAVLVLRGNGSSFCSGGDLNEFGSSPSPTIARRTRWRRDVWGLLHRLPKVTIAAVHGQVAGSGWEMALLCDFCIAAAETRFSFPETGRGLIPGATGTQSLPRRTGLGLALDLVLTGRTLVAAEALRHRLIHRLVPLAELEGAAMDMATELGRHSGPLVDRLKTIVQRSSEAIAPA